ncbi:GFA family protein [Mesorhizobium sp. M0488]|uniref:GFA family protein n=1 Tax=unclassified Mesorhizobium TaxID=325217 RepID=UPI0033389E86
MSDTIRRTGSCLCGGVQFTLTGPPLRTGICHCKDCRKTSGSAFSAFAIWPREAFGMTGIVSTYGGRSFCPTCGGRVVSLRDDEAEVMIGSLDIVPTELVPEYELWIGRRENWLSALSGAVQFEHDRPEPQAHGVARPRALSGAAARD